MSAAWLVNVRKSESFVTLTPADNKGANGGFSFDAEASYTLENPSNEEVGRAITRLFADE